MVKKNEKNCNDIIPEMATDIKWIKETHTKELSAINNHLLELNGSVKSNTVRGIENAGKNNELRESLNKLWKVSLAIMAIIGTVTIVLLECYLKSR